MPSYTITLHVRDSDDDIKRLRAALKTLLRSYGLRATKVEPEKPKIRLVTAG